MELEQQMILAAKNGQAEGYQYLIQKYQHQTQLLVAQLVPDTRDVEELTQDAFVRAFENLSDFDPMRSCFSTWLSHIAYNHALNHIRSQTPTPYRLYNESITLPDISTWENDDAEMTQEAKRLSLLNTAINRLRPEERTLLHLRYFESYSLGEIANIMKVAEGPLANRLQRIRQKLRKLITNEEHCG